MSAWVFLTLFFGLPIVLFAFVPRAFRRFCLVVCLPLVVLAELLLPGTGPDHPMVVLGVVPHAFLAAAIIVEIAVFIRRLLARRLVNG